MSTISLLACAPLRSRVRKSATGSVIDTASPARLRHAGDVAVVGQLAQADPAEAELAIHGAGPAALAAARIGPRLVLRRARHARDLGCLGHGSFVSLSGGELGVEALEALRAPVARERHAERVEQGERLGVGLRGGGHGDVEPADLVDAVVVDL